MVESNKVVVFQVNKEEYAISIQYVISIEKLEGITPIPHLPNYVKGMMVVRGELVPVIDLEQIFYRRQLEQTESSRLIVLKTEELSIGIFVEDAKEIIDIPAEKIKQVGLVAYSKTSYFTGVANLDSGLITLIDPLKLVQSLEGIKEIKEYMKSHQ
ncbi:chemotaxis protein CheW [Bacillus sp. CGMCC 1.16607]|uniref:chemotaxis protein CheW n=1 Tax=Bacillus sp. CGMCC 1.16607 TaxID=3351842 RepID=UPI00363FD01D